MLQWSNVDHLKELAVPETVDGSAAKVNVDELVK